jgi:hypothetical protein
MKLLQILCLTTMIIATTEAIQIENHSTNNAYINQITTLRNNGLGEVPYIEQTYIVVVPGQTIDTNTYGGYYQKVTAVSFNLGNSKFDISASPENSNARVTINNDGSVITSEGVGMSRHSQTQAITKQMIFQGPRIL